MSTSSGSQVKSEPRNANQKEEENNDLEMKSFQRMSSFHQSFVKKKSLDRSKSTRHTLSGSETQEYQMRRNFSCRNVKEDQLQQHEILKRSLDIRNQAQVKKVQITSSKSLP